MPIRWDETTTDGEMAEAITFAFNNGADIISNSWGYRYVTDPNYVPAIVSAIENAITNGRNRRGCVVLFAAGNTANHVGNDDGYITFPASVDISGVFTIGASDRYDQQANYSPTSDPGSGHNQIIDVVAPSHRAYPNQITGETLEMWSIDIPGNNGYNPYPSYPPMPHPPPIGEQLPSSGTNYLYYTGRFGGTSHSCPVVAGVAALVLSADQSLTYLEVFDILTATADEVGGYTYTNGWSEELGYGRVNACRAVFEAFSRIMSVTGPDIVCTSNSTFSLNNRAPGTTVNWTSSNLSYVSGQGTDNYTVKAHPYAPGGGPGWVQATISGDCGDATIRKDIDLVGTPYVNPATIQFTCIEGPGYFCTNAFGNEFSFSYSYDYNYFDVKLTNFSETQTLTQFRIYSTWGTLDYFPPDGTYKFMVRGNNDCGTATNWSKTTVDYVDCGGLGEFLSFFPNPATDEITMELKTDNIDTFTEGDKWEAEIFNQQMLLMHKTTRLKDKTYTINVSGWKEGIYYVRVKVKDKLVFGKFIVTR